MRLPFTVDQFFEIFRRYNQATWPFQLALNAIALLCLLFLIKRQRWSDPLISFLLSLLWGWMAFVYHFLFFSHINPAAYIFALGFILEAAMLFWFGVFRTSLGFRASLSTRSLFGAVLVLYALVTYPLLNHFFGHSYPRAPSFGVPCPTTIFTIGMFFFLKEPFPRKLFWIPLLWSLIGSTAAGLLDVPADYGLAAAGLLAVLLLLFQAKSKAKRDVTATA
jgi:hypothetical protein